MQNDLYDIKYIIAISIADSYTYKKLITMFSHVNICWKNRNNSWQSSSKYLWTFVSCVSGGLDHCRMVDMRQKVFLETLRDFVHVCLVQCLWKYFASVNIWWNKLISAWKYSSKYLWTSVSCVSGGLDHCRMVDKRQEVEALAQPGHQELQHPSQGQNIFRK